jgi:hypothetical protein
MSDTPFAAVSSPVNLFPFDSSIKWLVTPRFDIVLMR